MPRWSSHHTWFGYCNVPGFEATPAFASYTLPASTSPLFQHYLKRLQLLILALSTGVSFLPCRCGLFPASKYYLLQRRWRSANNCGWHIRASWKSLADLVEPEGTCLDLPSQFNFVPVSWKKMLPKAIQKKLNEENENASTALYGFILEYQNKQEEEDNAICYKELAPAMFRNYRNIVINWIL